MKAILLGVAFGILMLWLTWNLAVHAQIHGEPQKDIRALDVREVEVNFSISRI
jgi:hypothetical protein